MKRNNKRISVILGCVSYGRLYLYVIIIICNGKGTGKGKGNGKGHFSSVRRTRFGYDYISSHLYSNPFSCCFLFCFVLVFYLSRVLRDSTPRYAYPLVGPHFTFLCFCGIWLHCSCPNALVTQILPQPTRI